MRQECCVSDFPNEVDPVRSAKAELRAELLRRRRALSAAARAAADEGLRAALLELVGRLAPRCVAAYAPIGSEPGGSDLPDVLARAVSPYGRLVLPVLRSDLYILLSEV